VPSNILEQRRTSLAVDLTGIVREAEQIMARDDFNPEAAEYVALRENRETTEAQLADVIATINARHLAQAPAPAGRDQRGQAVSDFRRILREYDRGMSERSDLEYDIQRAYQVLTTDPWSGSGMFTPTPTRVGVAALPVYTPTLDSVSAVPTTNSYDFTVPPPPVAAVTVPENTPKPAVSFVSAKVAGTLETDAHILDVSRQTLEDDASAERTLRAWLTDGVRLKQDIKTAAAIAAATGTGTADSTTLLNSIRKGKAELSILGIRATTVYLHPYDAMNADIEAMVNAHTGPDSQPTLWGMTVIESAGVLEGTAIVGSLPNAVYLCYKPSINTYLTDSGMTVETVPRDRFQNNLLGILGEGRSKAHVVQPKLLVKCTVTPAP
jgi:hypothetical protein